MPLLQNLIRNTQYAIRNTKKAFTLVEIMVTTAVLALGAVLIYEAFFTSADTFDYCANYLKIAPFIDEKIWQTQNDISLFGSSANIASSGAFINSNKEFGWNLSYDLIEGDDTQQLYRIGLALSWQQGRRNIELSRAAYAIWKYKEQ